MNLCKNVLALYLLIRLGEKKKKTYIMAYFSVIFNNLRCDTCNGDLVNNISCLSDFKKVLSIKKGETSEGKQDYIKGNEFTSETGNALQGLGASG